MTVWRLFQDLDDHLASLHSPYPQGPRSDHRKRTRHLRTRTTNGSRNDLCLAVRRKTCQANQYHPRKDLLLPEYRLAEIPIGCKEKPDRRLKSSTAASASPGASSAT